MYHRHQGAHTSRSCTWRTCSSDLDTAEQMVREFCYDFACAAHVTPQQLEGQQRRLLVCPIIAKADMVA